MIKHFDETLSSLEIYFKDLITLKHDLPEDTEMENIPLIELLSLTKVLQKVLQNTDLEMRRILEIGKTLQTKHNELVNVES